MNHRDPFVPWQIIEADISIIAGQDSITVTVQFGPNFRTGLITGAGNGLKYDSIRQLPN